MSVEIKASKDIYFSISCLVGKLEKQVDVESGFRYDGGMANGGEIKDGVELNPRKIFYGVKDTYGGHPVKSKEVSVLEEKTEDFWKSNPELKQDLEGVDRRRSHNYDDFWTDSRVQSEDFTVNGKRISYGQARNLEVKKQLGNLLRPEKTPDSEWSKIQEKVTTDSFWGEGAGEVNVLQSVEPEVTSKEALVSEKENDRLDYLSSNQFLEDLDIIYTEPSDNEENEKALRLKRSLSLDRWGKVEGGRILRLKKRSHSIKPGENRETTTGVDFENGQRMSRILREFMTIPEKEYPSEWNEVISFLEDSNIKVKDLEEAKQKKQSLGVENKSVAYGELFDDLWLVENGTEEEKKASSERLAKNNIQVKIFSKDEWLAEYDYKKALSDIKSSNFVSWKEGKKGAENKIKDTLGITDQVEVKSDKTEPVWSDEVLRNLDIATLNRSTKEEKQKAVEELKKAGFVFKDDKTEDLKVYEAISLLSGNGDDFGKKEFGDDSVAAKKFLKQYFGVKVDESTNHKEWENLSLEERVDVLIANKDKDTLAGLVWEGLPDEEIQKTLWAIGDLVRGTVLDKGPFDNVEKAREYFMSHIKYADHEVLDNKAVWSDEYLTPLHRWCLAKKGVAVFDPGEEESELSKFGFDVSRLTDQDRIYSAVNTIEEEGKEEKEQAGRGMRIFFSANQAKEYLMSLFVGEVKNKVEVKIVEKENTEEKGVEERIEYFSGDEFLKDLKDFYPPIGKDDTERRINKEKEEKARKKLEEYGVVWLHHKGIKKEAKSYEDGRRMVKVIEAYMSMDPGKLPHGWRYSRNLIEISGIREVDLDKARKLKRQKIVLGVNMGTAIETGDLTDIRSELGAEDGAFTPEELVLPTKEPRNPVERLRLVCNPERWQQLERIIEEISDEKKKKKYRLALRAATYQLEHPEARGLTHGRWETVYKPFLRKMGVDDSKLG